MTRFKVFLLTNATSLSTEHSTRNAATFDLLTISECGVLVVAVFDIRLALLESTVERLHFADPELESTCLIGGIAAESHLWWAIGQCIHNVLVCGPS